MEPGITVTGTGAAYGAHDVCTLALGVEVQARTPQDALARVSYAATRLREALFAEGVDAADVATGAVALQTMHDPWPTVSGYTASVNVTAKTRDVDNAGTVLARAVESGGDAARVHQVSFSHSEPAALRDRARIAAFEDARSAAARYADLADRRLGEVVALSEGTAMPSPHPKVFMAASAPEGVPLDPGSGPVTVTVTVRFSLH